MRDYWNHLWVINTQAKTFDSILNQYKINIYEKWSELKPVYSESKDNHLISKLFEWYTCIKLSQEHKTIFYEYSDIDPDFREEVNLLSRILQS